MENKNNDEQVGLWNLLRLASYTFVLGLAGAYGFTTASEVGFFSRWPYFEQLFQDQYVGLAIGVLAGIVWSKYVNRQIDNDNSGWASEERFRAFLYAGIGSMIGLMIFMYLANRFFPGSQNITSAQYVVFIGGPIVGAIMGGFWALIINRDIRGRGAPLTDEEFEKLVKEEEAKMDDNGNYLPESELKNK